MEHTQQLTTHTHSYSYILQWVCALAFIHSLYSNYFKWLQIFWTLSHQEAESITQHFHDKIVTTSTNKGELLAFEFSSLGPCSFPLVFEHLLCRNLPLETSHLERSSVGRQSQLRPDLVPVIGSLMVSIHLSHTQPLNNILAGVLDYMEQLWRHPKAILPSSALNFSPA